MHDGVHELLLLRKMVANAWKWADQQSGRKRVSEVHGEEEIRVILQDSFDFVEEEGDTTKQQGTFDLEDPMKP